MIYPILCVKLFVSMKWAEQQRNKLFEARIKNPALLNTIYACISIVVTVLVVLITKWTKVPTPQMIFIIPIVLFTYLFGIIAGAVSTGLVLLYNLYFFSFLQTGTIFKFSVDGNYTNLYVFIISSICSLAIYALLALARFRQDKYLTKLTQINTYLENDNQKLKEISNADSLTLTKNRFALRNDFESLLNCDIHVMMYDIDNFKVINDTLGHDAGDSVLMNVGAVTKKIFGDDNCYRYGGDEFVIIMKDIAPEEFASKVKDLKQAINEIIYGYRHSRIHFSGGYVHGRPETVAELREMIKQADKLLYKAKAAGKDDTKHGEYVKGDYQN